MVSGWTARIGLVIGAALTGCGAGGFACQDDAQCQGGGAEGMCEPTGGCSFPDSTCPSGRRYGAHATGGLAGECVAAGDATDTAVDPTGAATLEGTGATVGSGASLTSMDGAADTTAGVSASAGGSTTDAPGTATDGTGTGQASTTDDGGASTGGDPAAFFDAFDRPNGGVIGNDWIEKTPGAFRLLDEQVELDTVNGQDFRNNIFYRPLGESMLDVEASVVVNFVTDDPFGYPQLHLRVQPGDVDTATSLTSYAVFVDSADVTDVRLTVSRIAGPGFGPVESVTIVPPPTDAETYRLRGRVTGTDPVMHEGFFEVLQAGEWQVRTQVVLVDDTADRITDPGTVGAAGHLELQHFVLDGFGYASLD